MKSLIILLVLIISVSAIDWWGRGSGTTTIEPTLNSSLLSENDLNISSTESNLISFDEITTPSYLITTEWTTTEGTTTEGTTTEGTTTEGTTTEGTTTKGTTTEGTTTESINGNYSFYVKNQSDCECKIYHHIEIPIECPIRDSFPDLRKYFENDDYSDFTFYINGNKIPVHKLVIAAQNPIFKKLFDSLENGINEPKDRIFLQNVDFNAFKIMINYFYTESFIINNKSDISQIESVYDLALKYEVKHLIKLIDSYLSKNLKLENFIKVFDFIKRRHLLNSTLTKNWREFVNHNKESILKHYFSEEAYNCLDRYTTECILFSMGINNNNSLTLNAIKYLIDNDCGIDINSYKRYINITQCSTEDLLVAKQLNIFDSESIFNELMRKYQIISHDLNDWKNHYYQLQAYIYRNRYYNYETNVHNKKQ